MKIELTPSGYFRLHQTDTVSVEIPVSAAGAEAIARILRERQYAPRPKIGTPAFPTQHVINIWMKEDARRKYEAERADLGIDLDELEIEL